MRDVLRRPDPFRLSPLYRLSLETLSPSRMSPVIILSYLHDMAEKKAHTGVEKSEKTKLV